MIVYGALFATSLYVVYNMTFLHIPPKNIYTLLFKCHLFNIHYTAIICQLYYYVLKLTYMVLQ